MDNEQTLPIGEQEVKGFLKTLQNYKAGKHRTEARILSSENWWKLRNTAEEQKDGATRAEGFASRSGWLHNVIVSKHADAVESYPAPNILPREQADIPEAKKLSDIIPCVLEQNHFEQTYSDVMWQKLKTGTGVYKVVWDASRLNGLGDIAIERVNLLNLYWEPGVCDIQKSRFLFHTELVGKELLAAQYPQLAGKLKGNTFVSARFLYDDAVNDTDKATVVDVYYRKQVAGRSTLQYCKFVDDVVLYATENDFREGVDIYGDPRPAPAYAGLYDHGRYPFVFDTLYPIEGSPCGYGFVDLCRNPQTEIDLLKTAFVRNARVGAVPRYFSRIDGNVREDQFLDLEQALVQVSGNVDEATLRRIEHSPLDGNYISLLDRTIDELRQTSGNTEASAGVVTGGVTAASAIAALQEAAGKGSRDSTMNAYRAFSQVVELCIALIRQFYDMPRQFRVVGKFGLPRFVTYTNQGLQPQLQGEESGYRLPVFDITVSAQKRSVYTKVSQNELALQFFQLGFFNPQLADQAMLCLEMMDFDGKDTVMQQIAQNRALADLQQAGMTKAGEVSLKISQADPITGRAKNEHILVEKARARAQTVSQPNREV